MTSLQPFYPAPNSPYHDIALALVRGVQDAFNAREPAALAANFAEITAWTGVAGKRMNSRSEIDSFAREVMPRMGDSQVRYAITNLLAIAHNLLVINVLQTPTDHDGNPVEGARGFTIYIAAPMSDGWKIVAGQNGFLPDGVES